MEKDKLDEFFNQKLPGRSFEPTEEYWKQAEALIEAQEKKRRNWKFLWWGLGIFLLLGFAITWKWSSNQLAIESKTKTTDEVLTESTPSISTEVENKETNNTLTTKEELKTIKNGTNLNASEPDTKKGETFSAQAKKTKTNATSNDQIISSKKSKTIINNQSKGSEDPSIGKPQAGITNDQSKQGENPAAGKSQVGITYNNNQTSPKKMVNNDVVVNNEKNTIKDPTIDLSKSEKEKELTSVNKTADVTKEENTSNAFLMKPLNLSSLPFSMDELKRELNTGTPEAYKSEYPKPRRRQFNMGVQGGVSLFPAKGNEKILNGWESGLTAQYQLTKNWLIGADVLYLRNRGTFNQSDVEIAELNYSFGSKKTTYNFERTSLSTLEVPLYAQYKIDKHRLEAGLSLNFLLGVRGAIEKTETLFPWERSNIEIPTQSIVTEEKWVSKDGFKKFYPALVLGYRFEMTKRFDIGMRARYVWAKNESITSLIEEGNQAIYQEFRPLSFRVNLRYYFIK